MGKQKETTIREWAEKVESYPRDGTAWVFKNLTLEDVKREAATIEKVEFGERERQGYGLSVYVKIESGMSGMWSFFSLPDIWEFMERTKASTLKELRGKPVFMLTKGFNTIAGFDVNDVLVLGRDD